MRKLSFVLAAVSISFMPVAVAQSAQHDDSMKDCPMHAQHVGDDSHHADVSKHGDAAMGIPHDKTTHHFLLKAAGGAIEITANDPNDKPNTEAIRMHLSHIAAMFAQGDFSTPMLIHSMVPPGATIMRLMKTSIGYRYEEIPAGGRVRIESNDEIAVAAVHDFLRFQITDHETGDPLTVADSR